VVADRDEGRARWTAAPDPARLSDALDDPPGFGVREGQARGAVGQSERLSDLALGERDVPDHQVGVDSTDCRRDPPRRTHLTPCVGELDPERLGTRGSVARRA
jgi:hypothetical protein